MKRLLPALLAVILAAGAPASAKDFISDQAGMFSPGTIQNLNTKIGNFNAQTGKEIIVQTVPSVSGGDVRAAAENAYSQQQVNGVLIFISKGDRKDYILPDHAAVQAGWWTSQTSTSIAQAMEAQFRAGDFDGGITTAVSQTFDIYRSHLGSLRTSNSTQTQPSYGNRSTYVQQANQGVHISVFWWIIIALVGFFIIRSIMRAASGPRYYGGPGAPASGAGSRRSGLWTRAGAATGTAAAMDTAAAEAAFGADCSAASAARFSVTSCSGGKTSVRGAWGNTDPTGGQGPVDGGGWQSDPGQADVGGGGGGDWGGGGFGGGDSGGGGGGDFGGGGGGDGGGGGGW